MENVSIMGRNDTEVQRTVYHPGGLIWDVFPRVRPCQQGFGTFMGKAGRKVQRQIWCIMIGGLGDTMGC